MQEKGIQDMVYQSFEQVIQQVKSAPQRARMAVAAAEDPHTLEAVLAAQAEGIVTPVLVGNRAKIQEILTEMGSLHLVTEEDIYDVADFEAAAERAVALVKEGKA